MSVLGLVAVERLILLVFIMDQVVSEEGFQGKEGLLWPGWEPKSTPSSSSMNLKEMMYALVRLNHHSTVIGNRDF